MAYALHQYLMHHVSTGKLNSFLKYCNNLVLFARYYVDRLLGRLGVWVNETGKVAVVSSSVNDTSIPYATCVSSVHL